MRTAPAHMIRASRQERRALARQDREQEQAATAFWRKSPAAPEVAKGTLAQFSEASRAE